MKADISWVNGGTLVGKCDGHTVVMDVSEDGAATSVAPSPTDMLLIGAGGCTSYDVVHLLLEAGQRVTGFRVEISASVEEEPPELFRTVHLHYHVTGHELDRAAVEAAIAMSRSTHSGSLITLGQTATITHEVTLSAE